MPDRSFRMHNPTHRHGVGSESGPQADPTVGWSRDLATVTEIGVWDGRVYCTGVEEGNRLRVFGTDGDSMWGFSAEGGITSLPAVAGDSVYVSSSVGHVHELDAASGAQRRLFDINRKLSVPVVVDDTIFVATHGATATDHVYALDTASGTEKWCFETEQARFSQLALVNGTVYAGAREAVYAVDAESGAERWTAESDSAESRSRSPVDAVPPTVVDGTVYVGYTNGTVHALDADSGAERWRQTVCLDTCEGVHSSPAVVDGTVYVGSSNGTVYALDADGGERRWSCGTDDAVYTSPAVVDGTVYVGSQDGAVYALDADGGGKRWTFATGGPVVSSPVVRNGTVYVGSHDGTVHALEDGAQSDTVGRRATRVHRTCSDCGAALSAYDSPAFHRC